MNSWSSGACRRSKWLGSTIRLWERAAPGVLANDLHACNNYQNGETAAKSVSCPTLIVSGELDVMAPSSGTQVLRDNIDGHSEVVIPGAGHIMMIEEPDPVIDAIAAFLGAQAT